jgi:hypothetical protein
MGWREDGYFYGDNNIVPVLVYASEPLKFHLSQDLREALNIRLFVSGIKKLTHPFDLLYGFQVELIDGCLPSKDSARHKALQALARAYELDKPCYRLALDTENDCHVHDFPMRDLTAADDVKRFCIPDEPELDGPW